MSAATDVLKKFMQALDTTTKSSEAALDEAVQACSSFNSIQEVIDSFLTEARMSQDSESFLLNSCGINLYNTDTGAISGADAGGSLVLDAHSVVPETGTAIFPAAATSLIDGLTVIWPSGSLTDSEKILVKDLNSWWIPSALQLIADSYGLTINAASRVSAIKVNFYTENDSTLASVGGIYYDTETSSYYMKLNINLQYYDGIRDGDPDGITAESGSSQSLDRTLAHEFVHAVMLADMNCFFSLPQFVKEGTADLVQGIDDKWTMRIASLAASFNALKAALSLTDTGTGSSDSYVAGYMLFRYLAKQAGSGAGLYYAGDDSLLMVGKNYQGMIWLAPQSGAEYARTVHTIDASSALGNMILVGWGNSGTTLIGGQGTNSIWGGGSSGDFLQGGTGKNIFYYGNGDGNDTISDFHSTDDKIEYYQGGFDSVTTSGDDVLIHAGSGTLTIKDMAAKKMDISLGGQDFSCWFGRVDTDNSVFFSSDINFYDGSATHKDTLQLAGKQDTLINLLSAKDIYYAGIDVIDASMASGNEILIGDGSSNRLIGGSGKNDMWGGGKAADTLEGGSGKNTFYYANGDGNDVISKSGIDDVIFLYGENFVCTGLSMQGNDLVISAGNDDSLTVKNWTESGSADIFRFASGAEYRLHQNAEKQFSLDAVK